MKPITLHHHFAAVLFAAGCLLCLCRGNANYADRPAESSKPAAAEKPAALPTGVIPLADITAVHDAVEKRHAEIRKILDQKISGDFSKLTVKEAMDRLSKKGKLFPVTYADNAIPMQSLDRVLKFRDTSRREVMRRLFDGRLVWTLRDELVCILDVSVDGFPMTIKTWSVADLAFPKASRRTQRALGTAALALRELFQSAAKPSDFDWLLDVLQFETSGEWMTNDGVGGTASVLNDVLRVRQTRKVHEEIDGLLAAIRLAAKGRLKGNMMFLHEPGYPTAKDAFVIKRWSRRITLEFKDQTLPNAIKAFSETSGIPTRLDTKALDLDGFDRTTLFSLSAKNVIAITALQRTLPEPLTYRLDRGMLVITTKVDAEEKRDSAIYDVSDLLQASFSPERLMRFIKDESGGLWQDDNGVGGTLMLVDELGAIFVSQVFRVHADIAEVLQSLRKQLKLNVSKPSAKPKPQSPDEIQTRIYLADDAVQAKSLAQAIPVFVATDTWKGANSKAAIRAVDDKIIVRQTAKAHKAIRAFLDDLDAADQTDRLRP